MIDLYICQNLILFDNRYYPYQFRNQEIHKWDNILFIRNKHLDVSFTLDEADGLDFYQKLDISKITKFEWSFNFQEWSKDKRKKIRKFLDNKIWGENILVLNEFQNISDVTSTLDIHSNPFHQIFVTIPDEVLLFPQERDNLFNRSKSTVKNIFYLIS